LEALLGFIERLPVQGKRIINFGSHGIASNESIKAFAKQAAGKFDLYVVKNFSTDKNLILRDRAYGEVPEIIKKALISQGVLKDKIIVEQNLIDSLDKSLKNARKGDLLVVTVRASSDDKFQVLKRLEVAARELLVES
jgi:hypothetical protein